MRRPNKHFALLVLLAALAIALAACGRGGGLEQAVKNAYLSGDTTRKTYDSICQIIKGSPKKYGQYLAENGEIDVEALQKLVDQVGGKLRPPMHWDIAQYGLQNLTLTVYFERSGSMVPYDAPGGRGQLKKAVNDMINHFPGDKVDIKIVNDNIYDYKGSKEQFLQDRDIYASTRGTGNAAYTDFQLILDKIFKSQKAGNVSILVTDLIYSPRDTRNVSVDKILNEENSLATSIFKQYHGKSVIVKQLMGDFDGQYYPYNGQPVAYKGERPFYIIIIADSGVIDRMAADPQFAQFLTVSGERNSYRFNQAQTQLSFNLVPGWKDNAGRVRLDRDDKNQLKDCQGDRETGQLRFTVAVNLKGLQKSEAFLTNAQNYDVQSRGHYTLSVRAIKPSDITGNNKAALQGMTHLLTFTGKPESAKDEITVRVRNDFPQWIAQSTSRDDSRVGESGFAGTTFGLESFLRGIYDAFSSGDNSCATLTVKLER